VIWNQGIGEGWSSFAVAGDRAVTLEQRGELECVTCYRLVDGQLLWNVNHHARHEETFGGVGPRSTPTIHDGRVYAQGATGRVWCIDLPSGQVVWTVDLLEYSHRCGAVPAGAKRPSGNLSATTIALTWLRGGSLAADEDSVHAAAG